MAAASVSQAEWLTLAVVCLTGIGLRWWRLDLLAVEHFDEGVYASNLLFGAETGYAYPGRQFFAPPLLPWLIEWSLVLGGAMGFSGAGWLPMLPGLVCGTLLIPSVWWIGRRWFSPEGGIAAAWLVACSGFQSFYSRTALTDPVVLLAMLWAVDWGWRAVEDGRTRSAVFAGAFTALAWWTKYSGWLPLAIVLSGGLCWQMLMPRAERHFARFGRAVAIMAGVVFLLWLPVLWDCQKIGGYSAVAANHGGYLQGWSNWGENWLRQNANVAWYQPGLLTWLFPLALVIAQGLINLRDSGLSKSVKLAPRIAVSIGIAFAGCALVIVTGQPLTLWLILGTWAIVEALRAYVQGRLSAAELRGGSFLAAWFAGLAVTTPLYQPYPRLCLPLEFAGLLGAAWWIHRRFHNEKPPLVAAHNAARSLSERQPEKPTTLVLGLGSLLLFLLSGGLTLAVINLEPSELQKSRLSARQAAQSITQDLSDPTRTVAYVYGDPALFYHLTQLGVAATPCGDLKGPANPSASETLLITGLFVNQQGSFTTEWAVEQGRYELLKTIAAQPSSLVLLDNAPGGRQPQANTSALEWKVYRVR